MDSNTPGTRRYFFEYLYHDAVERTKAHTGQPIMVSAARKLRRDLDANLAAKGVSFNDWNPAVITAAIDETLANVAGYVPLYADGARSVAYNETFNRFASMIGMTQRGRIAEPGPSGPRIPVSPYDPRWAGRATIQRTGAQLSYLMDGDIEQVLRGRPDFASRYQGDDLQLYTISDAGLANPVGRAYTLDDMAGLSRLMRYMSRKEYNDIRPWVLEGGRVNTGGIDTSQFMSTAALDRSEAVLEYLQSEGIPYQIVRDRRAGQIMARIEGTKITVRLTDRSQDESYVGRIYDNGMQTYFSTNRFIRDSNKQDTYVPTPEETVDLLRATLGNEIVRSDGSVVGAPGTIDIREGGRHLRIQSSYYPLKKDGDNYIPNSSRRTRSHMMSYKQLDDGTQVFIHKNAGNRSMPSEVFRSIEAGEAYLKSAVKTAQDNIVSSLDVDQLIAEAEEHRDDPDYMPSLSGDTEIAAIQRSYWDVLTGKREALLRPQATREEFDAATEVLAELEMDDGARAVTTSMLAGDLIYTGTPEEMVRAHAAEVPVGMIGTYELHEIVDDEGVSSMRRFDPIRVSKYMSSEHGPWRNTTDIVAAMQVVNISGDELLGDGYGVRSVKDRLAKFDPSTAELIGPEMSGSPVRHRLVSEVLNSLAIGGIEDVTAQIDANGIIVWSGNKRSRTGATASVSGVVGQIFDVGEQGDITTRFASGDNFLLIPGYEARISAQRPGENLSVEERTLLRGYEQVMSERIRYQITSDLMLQRSDVGESTSLNGAYRSLYDERLPLDFWEKAEERGLGRGWAQTVVSTLSRRVRYPNAMSDTFYEHWTRERSDSPMDLSNDNFDAAIVRSGGRNMAIISEDARGYFDPDMTNGSRMGTTFYLAEGAVVDPDTGAITPSSDPDDRAPLMKHPEMAYARFDAWDRRLMTSSILLHGTRVTDPENVAFTDALKGWTADDGIVISAEFAQKNGMLTRSGETRPLVVGDKVADMHGNKGVVGLIVDPNMDLTEAESLGIDKAVQMFRENEGLSIVMSPFSGVSRFNAGSAREIMDGDVSDLVLPNGEVIQSGQGSMRFVVTNKDVEAGTRFYDDDDIARGSGRRASAQLAWALGGKGARRLMADFYGPNSSATANLREYLIFTGLDLAPDGTLLEHRQAETSAERRLLHMPETVLTARGTIHAPAMRKAFTEMIPNQGGDLLIPFPLQLANGDRLEELDGKYRLPVLSAHLRAGQELEDGSVAAHDYTNQYMAIYKAAYQYDYAQTQLATQDLSPNRRATLEELLTSAPRNAQSAYDVIARSIKERQFEGKHNAIREGIMSSRLPNSATAVWTADPTLSLDTLSMGRDLAEGMGLTDGDDVMLWRDPVLRDGGVRCMQIKIDDRLVGVGVHPAVTKSFDGDFDGDSVGIARPTSEGARIEARELFSMEANLLDFGSKTTITIDGDELEVYPLFFHESLDTKVSEHFKPELADQFARLTLKANDLQSDYDTGDITQDAYLARGRQIVDQLDDFYAEALSPEAQPVALRFANGKDHVESVIEACVDTGAKGSIGKAMAYASYMGVDPETLEDHGETLHTRKEDEGVMVAVTVKTAVGIAGAYSQRGVKAMRNNDVKAVTELTYPVTQAQLQAKHDPAEAMSKYEALMGPGRSLWKGRAMTQAQDGSWMPLKDKKGREVQATPEQWVKSFEAMYTDPDSFGVSVNSEYVVSVAKHLTGPDGKMVDIENVDPNVAAGRGSTMDRLAYGGNWAEVLSAASKGENLFEGELSKQFAPYAIRRNWRAKEDFAIAMERRADPTLPVPAPEFVQVGARDVLEGGTARGGNRRSNRAQTVSSPRPRFNMEIVETPVVDESEMER